LLRKRTASFSEIHCHPFLRRSRPCCLSFRVLSSFLWNSDPSPQNLYEDFTIFRENSPQSSTPRNHSLQIREFAPSSLGRLLDSGEHEPARNPQNLAPIRLSQGNIRKFLDCGVISNPTFLVNI
jgi:hypothetical protein